MNSSITSQQNHDFNPHDFVFSRRHLLRNVALASLANPKLFASPAAHFAPRAKRIIWLTQVGAVAAGSV